ncbi:MAG: tRNA pseudouridine(55) synthase TruB [bacterium]
MTVPSGLFIADKPAGPTSHDLVLAVRRRIRGARVGHAGTLDPAATGVLLLLLGKATKLAETLMDETKEYEATIRLGRQTDSGDAAGAVTREYDGALPDAAAIRAILSRFVGAIEQVPPMVSALKIGGRRLYELAREGKIVPRVARPVRVDRLDLLEWTPPLARVRVVCGRGTYVRVLAEDIGDALGVGGTLDALRRTRVGPYRIENALSQHDFAESLAMGTWSRHLISMGEALAHLPSVVVSDDQRPRLLHGQPTPGAEIISFPDGLAPGAKLRILDTSGRLLATARAALGAERPGAPLLRDDIPFEIERVLADPEEVAS